MSGYVFSDDLTNVGEYVPNSFTIGSRADGSDKAIPDPTAGYDDKKLTYTFPTGTTGTRYIFFRTEISYYMLYDSNKEETVTNTARVFDGEIEKLAVSDSETFEFKWIEKTGATANLDYPNNTGEIIWTITANQGGATLQNAVITDVLNANLKNANLKWEEATLRTWNGTAWVPSATTFSARPAGDQYALGTINTPVQLTIRTSVITSDSFNIGHTEKIIGNDATISWTGKDGIGSGSIGVNIGLNPISKSVGTPNTSTHTVPWTVSVRKSDVDVNLYVLDLLVYGDSGFSWSNVTSHEVREGTAAGLSNLALADIKARNPQAQYNQKYVAGSFATDHGLEQVVYTFKNSDGKAVADLLVVTGTGGNSIDVTSATQVFTFDTVITNPNIYARNAETTVKNTAVLYSANQELNKATASVEYTSRMLAKDMLNRTHAANPDGNKNEAGAGTGAAYDYVNHTVVFRLHVNNNNLKGFTNDLTTVDEVPIGAVTLTDTLPDGWEFVDIETGTKFILYKGTSGAGSKVTAGDRIDPPAVVTGNFATPGQAVFTFTTLTEPYVILVKAKPTKAKIEEYFNGNATYKPVNTATLSAANWTPGETVTQKVEIKSQIIDKNLAAGSGTDQGVITWTVDYRPNNLPHDGAVIKDTLDVGLDLRIDADGKLILTDGNITAQEMTLNSDGSYSDGDSIVLNQG